MACWDSGHEFPDPPASTTIQVTMDKIKLTQLSDKYAVNSTTLQSLCDTVYKYLINDSSILITEYPFALRICLLEYFIFKLLQLNSGKIVLLHIPEFIQQLIPTLDVKYSKLFGGVLTHTLDSSKRVFTISYDQYSYVRFELLPKLPRDKMIYFYIGNDMINASLIPGFQNIQNFILTSKLLPSSVCDVSYSFVHFFGEDHNNLHTDVYFSNPNKTKINSDRNSIQSFPTPIPVPIHVPISAPIAISLDTLIRKHNIPEHTRLLEYLSFSTMECIERGGSVVIDGFSLAVLTCLLDYIIMKRLETSTNCLRTLIDSTNSTRSEFNKLGVMQTTDFTYLKTPDYDFSKRVLFIQILKLKTSVLNSVLDNCILVSYTKAGCRLSKVKMFNGSFVSLTTNKLSDRLLSTITKTCTHITYLSHLNEVRSRVRSEKAVESRIPNQNFKQFDHKLENPFQAKHVAIIDPIIMPTPNTELLARLIQKHNIDPYYTHILVYLASTAMDCIKRGHSIAIEGFNKKNLTCLLDYITINIMEIIPSLTTILDSVKSIRKDFINLEFMKSNYYGHLGDSISTSKQVLFTQMNPSIAHLLNTEYRNIILVTFTNCGYNFEILNLLFFPFVSLSHSKLPEGLLTKVTRPFLLITYLKDSNKVECTRRNDFNVSIPKEPQIISFNNIDILPENALPQSANKNVESTTLSKEIDQSIESLLDRLTNKYNCYLNPNVCSTVYYFIEEGESLIVDNFSKPQLLYIIDFVLSIKTFRKISFSETKTLIYCSKEDFQTKLQVLDVIRSEQYSFVNSDGTFDSNKKVLILNDISQKYCKILKERLKLDKSYLLIHLHKKSQGRFRHSFTHMSCCNVLGLCVDRTELFPKKQTFIHISQGEFDKLEVNDCRNNINKIRGENLNFIKDDKVTDNNTLEDNSPISQNILSIPENITPSINPLFLDKQNPITALIHQLFNKHQIEVLHTDLPTELCNVTFTFLMANRNVCVDGFAFTLISPILAVFALECVELGIPVKIHFGNYAILPRDKLENIHIIPNENLIQTLTENNDPMHLWMFIGTDHKLLTQIFPLLKITHQCIFLLSHAVPFIFERSILPITRIYKFLDCVFIRSFNQHNSQSFRDGFNKGNLPNSPRSLNSETPTCAIIPVDILPAISTETQLLTKIVPSNDSTIENSSVKIDNNHEANTDFELSDSCNDLSIEHEFPEPNQEFVVAIDDACLPENCAESSTEVVLINLTGNHTPDIPITNNLDCNYGINLNIICNNSEENDACFDSDILKLDSELLHKEIVLSEMEEKLSENKEDHNSPIPLEETHIIPDIINAANHVDSDRLSTEQVDENKLFSTEYITKLVSEEISELYPVTLPNNTILESNSTQSISPSEPGIQLVTSPLQAGVHTILYSSDSTYYNLIMHHVADVLNCLRNTLQVVITSQNPDICSQLLKLASIHVHSARGFLYKAGSIDSLCNYIIQHELQILSIPLSSLVSLIQTDSSLFLDNHILVYVEDPRINYLDNSMVLGVLTNNIAFQYIFLLPDKKPRFDHFPSPYCEIKFSDFSTKNESYFVEFNFED